MLRPYRSVGYFIPGFGDLFEHLARVLPAVTAVESERARNDRILLGRHVALGRPGFGHRLSRIPEFPGQRPAPRNDGNLVVASRRHLQRANKTSSAGVLG